MVFHLPYSSVAMSLLHQGAQEWTLLQVWAHQYSTEKETFAFIKSSVSIFKQTSFYILYSDGTWVHGTTMTAHLSHLSCYSHKTQVP